MMIIAAVKDTNLVPAAWLAASTKDSSTKPQLKRATNSIISELECILIREVDAGGVVQPAAPSEVQRAVKELCAKHRAAGAESGGAAMERVVQPVPWDGTEW